VINKLPEGYVLQVTGHADGSGPEEAAEVFSILLNPDKQRNPVGQRR